MWVPEAQLPGHPLLVSTGHYQAAELEVDKLGHGLMLLWEAGIATTFICYATCQPMPSYNHLNNNFSESGSRKQAGCENFCFLCLFVVITLFLEYYDYVYFTIS